MAIQVDNTQWRPTESSWKSRVRSHRGILLILLIFLILTTLFSIVVPLTQGGDELAHYRYIKFITQTGRLPVDFAEREEAWYRSDWPPLYHLLVSWAVSPLNLADPPLKDVGESAHRRLVGQIFYPRLIIYTEDVNWPWLDGILAWHVGRFISILFSAGALGFTYLTGLELCRTTKDPALLRLGRPIPGLPVALAATALLAFTPRYLFTSAMLGDDSLFILLSAIFIWLLLRALRGDDRWRVYAGLGLLLGLSITTKYSTGLLVLLIIPVVWWRAHRAGWRWWQGLGRLFLSWTFVVIGASWWFAWTGYYFNTAKEDGLIVGWLNAWLNTGPDVSMRRIFSFFSGETFAGLERPGFIKAGSWGGWLMYLFQTFWSELVLEHDPFFPWAYLLVFVFCGLALMGLWQLWRAANSQTRLTLGILILTVGLLFPFPILRFFLTRNVLETGQGRHILFPAAQAIPILLVLGWTAFNRKMLRAQLRRFVYPLPLIFLLLWSVVLLSYMAFTYPDPLPVRTTTFSAGTIPHPLEHSFGKKIQLSGYDLSFDQEQGLLNITLFWKALAAVAENYRVRLQLADKAGETQLTWLHHPVNGLYPTRAWDTGDVIRDKVSLPVAALPGGPYTLQVDLLHQANDVPLTTSPLTLAQFPLPDSLPLSDAQPLGGLNYRLWLNNAQPLRQYQTVPLSWQPRNLQAVDSPPTWALIGPDQVARPPVSTNLGSAVFIIGPHWPSGPYRLQLEENKQTLQTGPVLTVANEFRRFTLDPVPPEFIPVDATFANAAGQPQVKLLGYTLPSRKVDPGGGLLLTLYWQSIAPVLDDTLTFAVLLDNNLQSRGSIDRYPAGFYSPILWAENEVVLDEFTIPVQPGAPNGVYTLHVGQYRRVKGQSESLPLLHAGQPTTETAVVIGPLKVGGPPPGITVDSPLPQVVLNQTLGAQITLLGYDKTIAGDTLRLTLYWQVHADLQTDYTTFVHLRNSANETVAQKDSPPAGGRYPTSLWETGEIVVDEITLPVGQAPPGPILPVVGLYNFITGERLPTPGIPANEIPLETFEVKE